MQGHRVKGNLKFWGREGQKKAVEKATALVVGKKCRKPLGNKGHHTWCSSTGRCAGRDQRDTESYVRACSELGTDSVLERFVRYV